MTDKGKIYDDINEVGREKLIAVLPVLSVKIGLSQDELSDIIRVSKYAYSTTETKKWKMAWSTFLALILLWGYNEKTKPMLASIEAIGAFLKRGTCT